MMRAALDSPWPALRIISHGMTGLILAFMIAAHAPAPAPAPETGAALDRRCFRLMADLAEDDDPRVSSLGRMAAQYFLGRIDAAHPGSDPAAALEAEAPQGVERERLLAACGDAMEAGGRDFRAIGRALRRPAN
jgi:hypothetical protein